jgi:hypothetical protein
MWLATSCLRQRFLCLPARQPFIDKFDRQANFLTNSLGEPRCLACHFTLSATEL